MIELPKRLPAVFYHTANGNEPVRAWLRELDGEDRRKIGRDVMDIECNWPVGMPVCRSLSHGLWEVRSSISDGRIARIIFCIHEAHMYVLHGFIKKPQKTPQSEIQLALKRKKEITR